MYVYTNESGRDVNVRGFAFSRGREVRSTILLKGFQKAVDGGILKLSTEVAAKSDAKPSPADAPAEKGAADTAAKRAARRPAKKPAAMDGGEEFSKLAVEGEAVSEEKLVDAATAKADAELAKSVADAGAGE